MRDRLLAFLPPDVQVLTPEQFAQIEKDYWTGKTPIGFVINAGLIVGLVVGAVIVYQILYTDVTEHLPEYATLKAMGYDDGFFARLVAGEALILTVLGYVPGVITSFGVFRLMTAMSSLNPKATPATLAFVFVLIAGMCAVAGAFATRKLRQARPARSSDRPRRCPLHRADHRRARAAPPTARAHSCARSCTALMSISRPARSRSSWATVARARRPFSHW